jgi:hypothetical protein
MVTTVEKEKKYLTVSQLAERHPAFSTSAIRHLIFNAPSNQFHSVIFRVGRKLVLEETAFENWIKQQNQMGAK